MQRNPLPQSPKQYGGVSATDYIEVAVPSAIEGGVGALDFAINMLRGTKRVINTPGDMLFALAKTPFNDKSFKQNYQSQRNFYNEHMDPFKGVVDKHGNAKLAEMTKQNVLTNIFGDYDAKAASIPGGKVTQGVSKLAGGVVPLIGPLNFLGKAAGAKTLLQAAKYEAALGGTMAGASTMNTSFDEQTQKFNYGRAATEVGLGVGLGAAAPYAGKVAGDAIKHFSKNASNIIKGSDKAKIMRDMMSRRQQAGKQQAFAKGLDDQFNRPVRAVSNANKAPVQAASDDAIRQKRLSIAQAAEQPVANLNRQISSLDNQIAPGRQGSFNELQDQAFLKQAKNNKVNQKRDFMRQQEQQMRKTGLTQEEKTARLAAEAEARRPKFYVSSDGRVATKIDYDGGKLDVRVNPKTGKVNIRPEQPVNSRTGYVDDVIDDLESNVTILSKLKAEGKNLSRLVNPFKQYMTDLNKTAGRDFNDFSNNLLTRSAKTFNNLFKGKQKEIKKMFDSVENSVLYSEDEMAIQAADPKLYDFLNDKVKPALNDLYDRFGAVNSKFKFEKRDGLTIVRDIKDKEGLLKALGREGFEDITVGLELAKKQSPAVNDSVLINNLMRERKVKITPEIAQYYYSPFESLNRRVKYLENQIATGEYLGDLSKPFSQLVKEKSKTYNLNHLEREAFEDSIGRFFALGKFESGNSVIAKINNVTRMGLLSTLGSAGRQLTSATRFAERYGIGSTLESIVDIAMKKAPEQLKTKNLGIELADDVVLTNEGLMGKMQNLSMFLFNKTAMMENQVGILGAYKNFVNQGKRYSKGQKLGGNFDNFLNKFYEPGEKAALLSKFGKSTNKSDLDVDQLNAVLNYAADQGGLVLQKADKPLFASAESYKNNGIFSFMYNLQSYGLKNSKIIRQNVSDAIANGQYGLAIRNLVMPIASMTMANSLYNRMNQELAESYNNFVRGQNRDLTMPNEFENEVKNDYLTNYIPFYNKYAFEKMGKDFSGAVLDLFVKGGDNTVKLLQDSAKLAVEGRPQDIFNPDVNKRMVSASFPGKFLAEPFINASHGYVEKQAEKLGYATEDLELVKKANDINKLVDQQKEVVRQARAAGDASNPIVQMVKNANALTTKGKQEIQRAKDFRTGAKNYGTGDPIQTAVFKQRKKYTQSVYTNLVAELNQRVQSGKLTRQQYNRVMDSLPTILQQELGKAIKQGTIR